MSLSSRPFFPAYAATLVLHRALTDTTAQTSAFLQIPGQCNCAFPVGVRQGHFLNVKEVHQATPENLVNYLRLMSDSRGRTAGCSLMSIYR